MRNLKQVYQPRGKGRALEYACSRLESNMSVLKFAQRRIAAGNAGPRGGCCRSARGRVGGLRSGGGDAAGGDGGSSGGGGASLIGGGGAYVSSGGGGGGEGELKDGRAREEVDIEPFLDSGGAKDRGVRSVEIVEPFSESKSIDMLLPLELCSRHQSTSPATETAGVESRRRFRDCVSKRSPNMHRSSSLSVSSGSSIVIGMLSRRRRTSSIGSAELAQQYELCTLEQVDVLRPATHPGG
jgi:hypothetical protein